MKRALGVMLSVLLIADLASAADSFSSGLTQARANEASPEWQGYSGPFFEQLGPVLQRAMQQCFPASVDAEGTTFTIVFVVRGNGALAQLMVRPESNGATCVLKGIESVHVPPPPRPNWWAFLEMKVTR